MAFYKTASVPVLAVYQSSGKFSKCATKNADISKEQDQQIKKALNLISQDVLNAVSKVYNISASIDDYIFPIPKAVKADEPNANGDNFSHEELTRFSNKHRCQVYKTFVNSPLHIEHASEDPKAARGFLPDAHYVQSNPEDKYVLTVVAMDTTKDAPLASGLIDNTINAFSMGCICDEVQCSYCNKKATSDRDLCDCLRHYKMARIGGQLVYENCLGVEYQELSVVGDPAYEGALTQFMLQRAAHKVEVNSIQDFTLISSLLSKQDQVEVARYFKANINRLPTAMLHLADKIL